MRNYYKKNYCVKSGAGFTLIEMLVYLALFAIIIGGGVVTVYQIIQNSNSLQAKVILEEEGNFILAKLNWALTGAVDETTINIPDASTLQITKSDLTEFSWDEVNKNILLNSSILNSDRITVTSLNFSQPVAGEIQASTTLTTLSNDGKTFSQTFEITKYLRR